ncbi:DUF721 domain-containing protein [Candidatus Dependentiae bacterium]|nr:DUF721 domain-containing protein [Candidatus Dependentiae bacterium]
MLKNKYNILKSFYFLFLYGVCVFKHISELLNNFVPKKDEWKIKLFNNWDKVIGDLKDKVTIIEIKNKLLVLGVTHPAWAQELFMLSDILKNKINSLFGKEKIKYIRFKTLKKKETKFKNLRRNKFYEDNQTNINKTLNKKEYLSLTKIQDQELKENLKNFYFRCKKG